MVRHTQHTSQPTQLLVLDTFFNGSTTENSLPNYSVTYSPTPTHTSYGSETTIVQHLKTSRFNCSNRPSLTAIQKNSPHCSLIHTSLRSTTSSAALWIVSGTFSDNLDKTIRKETDSTNATDIDQPPFLAISPAKHRRSHGDPTLEGIDANRLEMARWLWLEREFTDRNVRGSNPTSASRLPLSRLGQPGSIPALVLPSGGMAVRHRNRLNKHLLRSSLPPLGCGRSSGPRV
ncbi:hypothetical protein CSKR_109430 [Clonorchis sinensis]|uniref:Uncharacterized protein n=1 Tax=Clonorchis sinensis TaxID=79923 RepID=A0A419PYH7_CLOSI|nr:hypothetical protein CSKR_109430 [Clonorchis sinensis]